LCPKEHGGDGKSDALDDCPTNDSTKIAQVDSLTRKTVAEWKGAIRTAVAGQAALARLATGRAILNLQSKALNNPLGAYASGVAVGYGKGEMPAGSGDQLVLPNLTPAFSKGVEHGEKLHVLVELFKLLP
jgi:hypothetical protein